MGVGSVKSPFHSGCFVFDADASAGEFREVDIVLVDVPALAFWRVIHWIEDNGKPCIVVLEFPKVLALDPRLKVSGRHCFYYGL